MRLAQMLSSMTFKASAAALLLLAAHFSVGATPALAVTPYSYGALPSNANDADMNNAYATWKSRRLDTSPSCGTRVDNGLGYTYSEGMAYGALMAAYLEPNDTLLKDLWDFYAANMDPRGVMNWSVAGNSCGNNGSNAATDADLDVAAALIRASRRWPASPNNW